MRPILILVGLSILFASPTFAQRRGIRRGTITPVNSEQYVGQYRFEDPKPGDSFGRVMPPNAILTISKEGSRLVAERPIGGGKMMRLYLAKVSDDKFNTQWEGEQFTITFIKTDGGEVKQLMMEKVGKGSHFLAIKLPSRRILSAIPRAYAAYYGKYQIEGSDLLFVFLREGERLFMFDTLPDSIDTEMRTRKRYAELAPGATDTVYSKHKDSTITFFKNNRGKVTHLMVEAEGKPLTKAIRID